MFLTKDNFLSLPDILIEGVKLGASDIHLSPNKPIKFRINGEIVNDKNNYIMSEENTYSFLEEYLNKEMRIKYNLKKSHDTSIQIEQTRARLHFYESIEGVCLSSRLIPLDASSMDKLLVPPIVKDWTAQSGIVVVSGLASTGKSTTIASMVKHINNTRNEKIVILEDPVEYIHKDNKSCIFQREVGTHSPSYADALKDVAREDTNIVVVGEVRFYQTMDAVFSMAEAGMSVFTSVHANSSIETIERIVKMFPSTDYDRIYNRLSWTLTGILNQKLIKNYRGDRRVLACEVLANNDAVKNTMRSGKIQQLKNILESSKSDELISYDNYIERLQSEGVL